MSATLTKPTLREILLDAIEDAYWARRAVIEGCRDCTRNPAGICADHRADNDAAWLYDDARKQLQRNPEHPEVLAVLAAVEGGQS